MLYQNISDLTLNQAIIEVMHTSFPFSLLFQGTLCVFRVCNISCICLGISISLNLCSVYLSDFFSYTLCNITVPAVSADLPTFFFSVTHHARIQDCWPVSRIFGKIFILSVATLSSLSPQFKQQSNRINERNINTQHTNTFSRTQSDIS